MAEEKVDADESGTWNITKSQITALVQSHNPNDRPSLVSTLHYNPKKQIAFRIALTASPANNGMINLNFQLNASPYNYSFQITCNQPYFSKTDNTSDSMNHSVNKSTLLSCNGLAIQYTIQTKPIRDQSSLLFSLQASNLNYNQSNRQTYASLSSSIKPISFEFTVTSAMMQQAATKVRYQGSYNGVLFLKSIHDTVANTVWSLYLQCGYYQRKYSLIMQPQVPQFSKVDEIYAWIDIECCEVMYYSGSCHTFHVRQRNRQRIRGSDIASLTARVTNEQTVKFKCNIFVQKCTKYEVNAITREAQQVNITSELCPVSMVSDNSGDGNDALKKQVSEMTLQIQALSTGLNNVIRVNQQLNTKLDGVTQIQQQLRNTVNTNHSAMSTKLNAVKEIEEQLRNTMDTNHSAVSIKLNGMKRIEEHTNHNEMNRKLDAVTAALSVLTNKLSQENDDHKSNDNVAFDPVYAVFFYWINNTVCLPKYVNAFKESGYDSMDAVVELNDEKLQSIGINIEGHRVRLLKAIKKYTAKQQKEGIDYI
eukprot:185302_1